jgi:chemotaxis receptor (MCP) glutamine deamidase CheD
MKLPLSDELGGRQVVSIHIGGVISSRKPLVVRTVLGSCISVCLRDPRTQVGGMNHFMLPSSSSGEATSARYGVHAMELLINECMKCGAERRRLEAKVFGGGHVLKMRETDGNVPQSNIAFALKFLETEGIPILSRDLGGYSAREVYFFTDSGRTLLRRLTPTGSRGDASLHQVEVAERDHLKRLHQTTERNDDSNVTIF